MGKWLPAFSYVPINYNQALGNMENITQVAVIRNNLDGSSLRLRFCNLYNSEEIHIEAATIFLRNRISGCCSREYPLTLDGQNRITIPADAEILSDSLPLSITYEDDFIIRFYFQESTIIHSCLTANHFGILQSVHYTGVFQKGCDQYAVRASFCPGLSGSRNPNQFIVGFSSILVETHEDAHLLALFGDSITHMSYFSDALAELLYRDYPGKIAVINCGIAGNRVARPHPQHPALPGNGAFQGIAGVDRFLSDVYKDATPDWVFIMEGVNDSTYSFLYENEPRETPENIYATLCRMVRMAKAHGSNALVSTTTPFGSVEMPWRDAAESVRCVFNDLIRATPPGDAFFDMDRIIRDPENSHFIQEGMHLGDYTHPNAQGGRKMAEALYRQCLSLILRELFLQSEALPISLL